jgi:glutamyl-tRNA synthetase
MNNVVTRFAPSPTGLLHPGNYRTAVFAYLFAKHTKGSFVLRIEDTDKERSKAEYEANIIESLAWLALPFDTKYRQSDHAGRHHELLETLVKADKAYVSKEEKKNENDREEVIRFRNPGGTVSFTDLIRGEITMNVDDLGDFIIARSFDEPVFHFAVVVDDADEGVTHVIRGEDHISNTPRQILIQRALGFSMPLYAHLPLILGSDRTKLSKRKGARALTDYRDQGILPEAMLNYLALLGWNPGDDREYLDRDTLIKAFDLIRVQKGAAIFDETKLLSVNQHWMRELSVDEFITRGNFETTDQEKLRLAVPLLKDRAHSFSEARDMLKGELLCLFENPVLDAQKLLMKEPADRPGMTLTTLKELLKLVQSFPEEISAEEVKDTLMPLADIEEKNGKGGRGAVLWPLRFALSGQDRSPDPFTLISILGSKDAGSRIQNAITTLERN